MPLTPMIIDIILFALILATLCLDISRAKNIQETTWARFRGVSDDLNARTRNREMLHNRLNHHNERLEELEKERKLQLELAGGGVWKTQSGYVLRIRDMSTNHLQNTLKMFCNKKKQEPFLSMQRELDRRAEDKEWELKTTRMDTAFREWEEDCAAEKIGRDVLRELNAWLGTRTGKGISVGTVRRKITELLK